MKFLGQVFQQLEPEQNQGRRVERTCAPRLRVAVVVVRTQFYIFYSLEVQIIKLLVL